MQRTLRALFIFLSAAAGCLFIYAAYTKLFPIEAFEYTMKEYIHMPALVATIASRLLIGLEAALGALMILHLYGKNKWPLKAAFVLLAAFSIYLTWLWVVAGNNVNCGCFGDAIWMSPTTSLIKNAILLFIIGLLIRRHTGFTYKWAGITAPILLVVVIALTFILFPVFHPYKINLSELYTADKMFAPSTDLAKGKHIIAFLSPSCIHCRRAALKMHHIREKNPSIPFFMIIGGTKSDLAGFWKDSQAQDIPYTRLSQDPFLKYTHGVFPMIIWVNNSWVEADVEYPELNQAVIEKWMKD